MLISDEVETRCVPCSSDAGPSQPLPSDLHSSELDTAALRLPFACRHSPVQQVLSVLSSRKTLFLCRRKTGYTLQMAWERKQWLGVKIAEITCQGLLGNISL